MYKKELIFTVFENESHYIYIYFHFVSELFQTDGQKLAGTMCDHQFISAENGRPQGRFYSPRYPSSYPKNIRCSYKFRARYVSVIYETLKIESIKNEDEFLSGVIRNQRNDFARKTII